MRIVLDTNVLIAAFVARGQCHELVEHAVRNHVLFTSEFILDEFRGKLTEKFRVPQDEAEETLALSRLRMRLVEPVPLPRQISRDPDDDQVLATAVAATADCLITGDSDLLEIGDFEGILILRPAAFWEFESTR